MVLAGPMLNCQFTPHVQTHAFIIRTDVLSLIVPHHFALSERELALRGKDYIVHAELGISIILRAAGYNVISRSIYIENNLLKYEPEICQFVIFFPPMNAATRAGLIFYKVRYL